MEVQEALTQIAEIHRHVVRTECYRGYRSATMAITGVVAVLGGAVQSWLLRADSPAEFVRFWLVLAGINLLLVSSEIVVDYYLRLSRYEQRLTCQAVAQFLPCLTAAALVTVALCSFTQSSMALLPGLWCLFFSMGVFASRPYLPHGVGWVGLFYLFGGGALLALAPAGLSLEPWGMGAAFGVGQFLLAMVLYWNLERTAGSIVESKRRMVPDEHV